MVVATYLVLAAAMTAAPAVGVLRGGAGVTPEAGLLRADDRIRTSETGWADVQWLDRGRLVLFPQTEVQIGAGGVVRLVNGRIWLHAHRSADLRLRSAQGQVKGSASVIIEDTRSGGLVIAVRTGEASVGSVTIAAGQVWRQPVLGTAGPPKRGGDELADLLRQQYRTSVGDRSGLFAWLLAEIAKTDIGAPRGLSPGGVVRSEQEAAAASSSGLLTEGALRPPPFFEEEVPALGARRTPDSPRD